MRIADKFAGRHFVVTWRMRGDNPRGVQARSQVHILLIPLPLEWLPRPIHRPLRPAEYRWSVS